MRCAEISGATQPLRLVERPRPTVPDGGILVKTSHAGICHSDLHFIEDKLDLGQGIVARFSDPLGDKYIGTVLGHEVAGVIEEFGKDVNPDDYGLSVGDKVAVYPWWGCMECGPCSIGFNNRCDDNKHGSLNLGQGVFPGGYSTHVQVPSPRMVIKVPEAIPMHIACMLPCSGGTAFEALKKTKERLEFARRARPNQPARLLIVSAGGLGLWCLRLAPKAIPGVPLSITVVDIDEKKLAIASDAGAHETVQWAASGEQNDDVMKTISGGRMDAAIDFVGRQRTSEIALKCLGRGGALVMVGLAGGELRVSIPLTIVQEISIHGNLVLQHGTVKELMNILAEGDVKFEDVELVRLDDVNVVLDRLRAGKVPGRAVIKYD